MRISAGLNWLSHGGQVLHHLKRALWMFSLRLATPFVVLFLSLLPPGLEAQDPTNTIALTPCYQNKVATYVNVAMLGTDSTKEILAHEAVHVAQAKWSIEHLGHCPDYSDHLLLLGDEVAAYCVSSELRIKRKDAEEVNYSTVMRLRNQFQELPADTLIAYWQRGCPKFAFPKRNAERRSLRSSRLVTDAFFCASDIECLVWRPYVRLGDTPAGSIYIALSGSGEACLVSGMQAAALKIGDRLECDWRAPSNRN
jgi:hypothetical protein